MKNAFIKVSYDKDGFVDCHIEGSAADTIKLATVVIDTAADAIGINPIKVIGEVLKVLPFIQTHKAEGLAIDISALDGFDD